MQLVQIINVCRVGDLQSVHNVRKVCDVSTQGFEVLNDVVLNQMVATLRGHEHRMSELARAVYTTGEAWFGSTTWQGRKAFGISVSSWATAQSDVDRRLAAIDRARNETRT